jgi:hypothetical protein
VARLLTSITGKTRPSTCWRARSSSWSTTAPSRLPGSVVYGPRDILHAFKNVGTTPSRMLVLVAPAGLERFFEEVGEPATDVSSPPPLGPAEIEKLLAAAPQYGQEIPPSPEQ